MNVILNAKSHDTARVDNKRGMGETYTPHRCHRWGMSDFSVYTAEQIRDWMSQGTVATPPTDLYVTVFDDTDTERSSDLGLARLQTDTGADWNVTNTSFENANQLDLGEATTDINNIEDIALFDAATGGNLIARYTLGDAVFDISEGTNLIFNASEITFDIIDRTE